MNIFGLMSIIIAFGMGGYIIYFAGIGPGVAVCAFWFFFYYANILFYFYNKNNSSLPRKWVIATAVIIIGVCLVSLIAALILDTFNDFFGFSISYLVFNAIIFIYSYGLI